MLLIHVQKPLPQIQVHPCIKTFILDNNFILKPLNINITNSKNDQVQIYLILQTLSCFLAVFDTF